jgi:hypothetical protein
MRRWLAALGLTLALVVPAGIATATSASSSKAARFEVGAAVESFTPPPAGTLPSDPANCVPPVGALFNGPRRFAFEEPYVDAQGSGHYDLGDPFLDCNHNGRWDGNFLGGGANTPRYYDHVADDVGARALVVSGGKRTIALEVVDQEGLFNVYAEQIRRRVLADGYRLDDIEISATHDESAPDTLGLGGASPAVSGVNQYFVAYLVAQSAKAIEAAYAARRPATIRYAQAIEPRNLRQCWSSYPFIDDQLMPVMQAVATNGKVIVTLASVSQHTETLGFNGGSQLDHGFALDQENRWVSADWPRFFRLSLEHRYGGIGIEMAGSVGSVETPEVFTASISRTPQRVYDASHPAGCRTLFASSGTQTPLGYYQETTQLGQDLAGAVEHALSVGANPSRTSAIWSQRRSVCIPVDNLLFKAAALAGVFAARPAYLPGCTAEIPAAPTGQTAGVSIKTEVAAWRIGDAEFLGLPGEVFPFTFFRGPVGPQDMNHPQYPLPPWPLPYMHTPFRFFDGLDNDMIGYVFPQGDEAGIPTLTDPNPSGTDHFGCGHSDDSESVSAIAADRLGTALVGVLSQHGRPESVQRGRYVLPDGRLSRNPLGSTDTVKCSGPDTTFHASGAAVAVWVPANGVIHPLSWMDLAGRPQTRPDRNTRGFIDARGIRHWLDVFGAIAGQPARVNPNAGRNSSRSRSRGSRTPLRGTGRSRAAAPPRFTG